MIKKVEQDAQKDNAEEETPEEKERGRENGESGESEEKPVDGMCIFCPICGDYISHSVTTVCEHTFCDICLQEYLIFLDECPECHIKVRTQKFAHNILLDNLILEYIKKFEEEDLAAYQQRLDEYKEYKRKRTLTELETGMQVDVRDQDYVWCTGKVIRTVNKYHDKKTKYVMIKYDKGNKKEELPEASPRLAPRGFFTAREDLPRYERGKLTLRDPQLGVAYLLSKESDEEEAEVKH